MISLERFVRFEMGSGSWLSQGEQGIFHSRQGVGEYLVLRGEGVVGKVWFCCVSEREVFWLLLRPRRMYLCHLASITTRRVTGGTRAAVFLCSGEAGLWEIYRGEGDGKGCFYCA